MASQDVPRLTAQQLYTRMAQGEPVMALDVRTAAAVRFQPEQSLGRRPSLPIERDPLMRAAPGRRCGCELKDLIPSLF